MTKRSHGACNLRSRRRSTEVPNLLIYCHCQPVVCAVATGAAPQRRYTMHCNSQTWSFRVPNKFLELQSTIYVFRLGMLISVAVVIGLVGIEDAICIYALVILKRYNMYTFSLSILIIKIK